MVKYLGHFNMDHMTDENEVYRQCCKTGVPKLPARDPKNDRLVNPYQSSTIRPMQTRASIQYKRTPA